MTISYAALTKKGFDSKENQDRIIVAGAIIDDGYAEGTVEDHLLAVVCDGVGSASNGAKAAAIVGESFRGLLDEENPSLSIFRQIEIADGNLNAESRGEPLCDRMASTVAGVYLDNAECIVFNVGDTRVYELEKDGLQMLSDDHTRAQAMVDALFARTTEELPSKTQSTITRYLGGDGACRPAFKMRPFDKIPMRVAICSDGAYKALGNERLEAALGKGGDPRSCCDAVYEEALASGSRDDFSIIVLQSNGQEVRDHSRRRRRILKRPR